MNDVALICSVIPPRHELLQRSIQTWQSSIKASGLDVSINIWSEGASWHEFATVMPPMPNTYFAGQEEFSGSHIKGFNYWFERADSKVCLFTHPDLLYPKDTIAMAFANATDDTFVAFKAFWMGQKFTENIDNYDWNHPETLEHEQILYDDDPRSHGTMYSNDNIRSVTCWESSTSYAINQQTAARMYPLPDFGIQGADDVYQLNLRQRLGIHNYTVLEPILCHQWHPATWDGDEQKAIQQAQKALQERFGG